MWGITRKVTMCIEKFKLISLHQIQSESFAVKYRVLHVCNGKSHVCYLSLQEKQFQLHCE